MIGQRAIKARFALGGAVVACMVASALFAALRPNEVASLVEGTGGFVRGAGALGIVLIAAAQVVVAVSGILPAALLGAAAGAIYGLEAGFAIAAASTLTGAALAFFLSRSLFRSLAERKLAGRPRLLDLDQTLAREGWRIVCLLRMSPVMPFSATSFALGLSSVRARDYMIGTLAAMPALFGYVLLGTLTQSGLAVWSSGAGPLRLGLITIGVFATLALTLRLGRIASDVGLLPKLRFGSLPVKSAGASGPDLAGSRF